jgi:hypothetical protein
MVRPVRRGIEGSMEAMPQSHAQYYARLFGLPAAQMKKFCDLTGAQKERVNYYFGLINANNYIYAIKSSGGIVSKREKRNEFIERLK